jgi:multidrug transporter EmrE-like cation transporter
LCVLFSALASIFLKIGAVALTNTSSVSALVSSYNIWLGALFYSAAFLVYIYVLKGIPLSLAQPVITAGASVVTALVAIILFRESMALVNWTGLILICVGIFFLFFGRT